MSLFKQAAAATAEKAASAKKPKKKSTMWLVGGSDEDKKVAKSVKQRAKPFCKFGFRFFSHIFCNC